MTFPIEKTRFVSGPADQFIHLNIYAPINRKMDERTILAISKGYQMRTAYSSWKNKGWPGKSFNQIMGWFKTALQPKVIEAPPIEDIEPDADERATVDLLHKYGHGRRGGPALEELLKRLPQFPIGIMYYDRLRMRPVGSVPGELLYSISLAPGEETTLHQKSYTKRSEFFEEIKSFEQEWLLDYESSWSTDFSQQFTDTRQVTRSKNIGGGATAVVPKEVLGFDLTARLSGSYNIQRSHTETSNTQRKITRNASMKSQAKAKKEHKTTFRVSTEVGEEEISKRIIRNTNPDKSLTLKLYKVLQKYRVTLERYDAKLCANFCIEDPGSVIREWILEELEKLSPKISPEEGPQIPEATLEQLPAHPCILRSGTSFWSDWGSKWEGDFEFNFSIPDGHEFLRVESRFVKCVRDTGTENDEDWFNRNGGQVYIKECPPYGTEGDITIKVHARFPEEWGYGWFVEQIHIELIVYHQVTDETIETKKTERETWISQKKEERAQLFSEELVNQIMFDARFMERQYIFSKVIENELLPEEYKVTHEVSCKKLSQVSEWFEWDQAHVEYFPWWFTEEGKGIFEKLREDLDIIPHTELRSKIFAATFLTASRANILLPIKKGYEKEAIKLVINISQFTKELSSWVNESLEFIETTFPIIDLSLPTYEEITSPILEKPTFIDSNQWDNDWEKPQRAFLVLDDYAITMPTDGVHLEPVLGSSSGTDDYRKKQVEADTKLIEDIATKSNVDAHLYLSRKNGSKPQNSEK